MHIDFLLLNFIKYSLPNSSQIDNILLRPLMLGLSNVTSSAYPKLPIYLPWIWHPIPDFFNLNPCPADIFYNLHLCAGFFPRSTNKLVINQSSMDQFIPNKVFYNFNNVYYQFQYNR